MRRRLKCGEVVGLPNLSLEGAEILQVHEIKAMPKVGSKWQSPPGATTTTKDSTTSPLGAVVQTQLPNSEGEPPGSPTAGDGFESQHKTAAVSAAASPPAGITGPIQMIPVDNPLVTGSDKGKATVGGRKEATASTPAEAPSGKSSPAQKVSDDSAWEEVLPMVSDVLAEEAKISVHSDPQQVFQRRCEGGPFAAVAKGRFLTEIKLRKDHVKDLASRALAKSTVQAHKRTLRFLQKIPEKFWDLNLDRAMEQYFLECKTEKRWLPTTTVVKMATAHGALRLLPLYAENQLPVYMKESVLWMQAMKAVAKMAKQQPAKQPTATCWKEVETAIDLEPVTAIKMAVLTTWLACGRGGDVLLLKPSDIEMTSKATSKGEQEGMSISFWKGKTVKTRGSYTVFTQRPPPKYWEMFVQYKKEMMEKDYLFKGVRGSQIKDALRRSNPKLEQRSLRRGAIQTLAATGLTDEELLHYSGHTNVSMLRRYLNFGKLSGEGARLSAQAAALVTTKH